MLKIGIAAKKGGRIVDAVYYLECLVYMYKNSYSFEVIY